jgi:hypothetical protein
MPKFTVRISAMAEVSQTFIVEAENAEDARYQAIDSDTYNNNVWAYEGIDSNTVACEEVNEVEG